MAVRNYLQLVFWHHRLGDYLVSAAVLLVGLALPSILRVLLRRWASQAEAGVVKKLVEISSRPFLHSLQGLTVYAALRPLAHQRASQHLLHIYASAVITIGVARLMTTAIHFLLIDYWPSRESDRKGFDRQLRGFMPVVTISVWGIGAVCLLDALGMNISAVVAGLGIGGVAIALASQTVLADLFAYFAILFDRPFDIDDFIMIDQFTGTVEYIGVKTTRLRSVSGEQLVVANSDLTKSKLRNYRRMQNRRVEILLQVAYGNAIEKLERLPALAESIFTGQSNVKFKGAYLTGVDAAGFTLNIAYVVLSDDFGAHMNIQQRTLLAIKRAFDANGIALALPTQKFVFEGESPAPPLTALHPQEITSGDHAA